MNTPLSAQDLADLAVLAALPEESIDTADIPEAPAGNWLHARRGGFYRPIKKPVTLRLDADLIDWFKRHPHPKGYQTEINRVLRLHVEAREAVSAKTC